MITQTNRVNGCTNWKNPVDFYQHLLLIVVLSASSALSTSSFTMLARSVIACSATIRRTESSERRLISDDISCDTPGVFLLWNDKGTREGGQQGDTKQTLRSPDPPQPIRMEKPIQLPADSTLEVAIYLSPRGVRARFWLGSVGVVLSLQLDLAVPGSAERLGDWMLRNEIQMCTSSFPISCLECALLELVWAVGTLYRTVLRMNFVDRAGAPFL